MDAIITAAPPHTLNWTAGWFLVLAGIVAGALLGLGFHRPDFLGGYDSFRRRLLRLGHIALMALGIVNVVFGLSPWPEPGSLAAAVAGPAFLTAGITMPLVCFLAAWREKFRHLFFIPVIAFTTAVITTAFFHGGGS